MCWQLLKNKTVPENLPSPSLLHVFALFSTIFSFLFSFSISPPNYFTLFWHRPLILLVLTALKRFPLSPIVLLISHSGRVFQSLCRNKWKGGFVLFLSACQLSACISSLPILLSHPRYRAFRKYPAGFLNAFRRVEFVLVRFLCLLMLAKEVQLFIWHQLFKQKKEQDGTISGQPFLDSSQAEFRASNSVFVPSCWKEALCALLTSMLAYLIYWNWWAGLSLCARSVPSGFPFTGRHSKTTKINDAASELNYCHFGMDGCVGTQSHLLLQLGGDPDEGALCLRKIGIRKLLGRNRISSSYEGPCPGSQAFHQTLLQQLEMYGSRESALFFSLPIFSF